MLAGVFLEIGTMNLYLKLLCLGIIPLLGSSTAIPRYGIDFWREAEGLPQSRIRAIVQTRDGYLWLGSDNGVVRFNGASFTSFTVETGSLKDNEVWALLEDDENALWIATYGGGVTRFQDGRFKTFTTADGLPDDVVTRLDKDLSGNVWLSTPAGLSRYSRGVFTTFPKVNGAARNGFGAFCARCPQGVIAATASQVFRLVDGRFELLPGVARESEGTVEQLVCARDGSLWIGYSNAVIKRWKDGATATYAPSPSHAPQVTLLYEDPAGDMWAAFGQRLHRFKEGRFESVILEDQKTELGVVYSMYTDREGSVWVGLQSNGLGRLRVNQLSTITSIEGLPNDSARSVFQDKRGDIWIGTASGFGKFKDGRVRAYAEFEGRRLGPVRSFAEDPQGNLWVASGSNLLLMKEGRLTRVPGWRDRSEIEVIYKDREGGMWVGTDGDGLFKHVGTDFRNYGSGDGMAGNRIRAILQDRRGTLWISAFGHGVTSLAAGKFTNYGMAAGLAGNRVSTIHEDEEGTLWFATRGGLTRFKDGRFFSYTSASGLLVNFVYTILDDGRGSFWFSCAQGLFKVSKAELRDFADGRIKKVASISYGVRDGMKTRACNVGNQPAAWKAANGMLLFSSMKGIVMVPSSISSSNFVPPVYIESVSVNRHKQQLNREPTLPLGAGEVQVDYAALSYLNPEKVRFKYMLEGFDTDWADADGRRFAYYANLPPGKYRFHVIAGNMDGSWNQTGASFSFYLSPRFYQTRLFLACAATGILLLAWLLYRLRVHELKARYSAVLAERNRISQDIHDTFAQNLAGIALQLDSMTMQLEEIPPALRESIDEACNLTRYSLAEARRAVSDLRSGDLDRAELSVALPEIANRMAASTTVRMSIQVLGTPQALSAVAEKNLMRIFQEAIANALKHAQAQAIDVELRYEEEGLALRVRDDGRGFDAERAIPLAIGHYGLTGMRERAERIGGCLTLKSAPGEGTELLIVVPFAACAEGMGL